MFAYFIVASHTTVILNLILQVYAYSIKRRDKNNARQIVLKKRAET